MRPSAVAAGDGGRQYMAQADGDVMLVERGDFRGLVPSEGAAAFTCLLALTKASPFPQPPAILACPPPPPPRHACCGWLYDNTGEVTGNRKRDACREGAQQAQVVCPDFLADPLAGSLRWRMRGHNACTGRPHAGRGLGRERRGDVRGLPSAATTTRRTYHPGGSGYCGRHRGWWCCGAGDGPRWCPEARPVLPASCCHGRCPAPPRLAPPCPTLPSHPLNPNQPFTLRVDALPPYSPPQACCCGFKTLRQQASI